jgi:hypothetical protein
MDEGKIVAHHPREYFALVDIETYPAFAGPDADHLDIMAHLHTQARALTAVAWGAPDATLHLRFYLTENDQLVNRLAPSGCGTTASGWVRTTSGQLCLTSHDRLVDCARHRDHGLLRRQRLPRNDRPILLNVPPGTYSVLVLFHLPFAALPSHPVPGAPIPVHYTVLLRHYALPAPRVAPIRLPGLQPWAA